MPSEVIQKNWQWIIRDQLKDAETHRAKRREIADNSTRKNQDLSHNKSDDETFEFSGPDTSSPEEIEKSLEPGYDPDLEPIYYNESGEENWNIPNLTDPLFFGEEELQTPRDTAPGSTSEEDEFSGPDVSSPEEIQKNIDARISRWWKDPSEADHLSRKFRWDGDIEFDWLPAITRTNIENGYYAMLSREVVENIFKRSSENNRGLLVLIFAFFWIKSFPYQDNRRILISGKEVADEIGFCRQHIATHIKTLERIGGLKKKKKKRPRGPGTYYQVQHHGESFVYFPASVISVLAKHPHLALIYAGLCYYARVYKFVVKGKESGLGETNASNETLAETIGRAESTVKRQLRELAALGLVAIKTEKRKRKIYLPDVALLGNRLRDDIAWET